MTDISSPLDSKFENSKISKEIEEVCDDSEKSYNVDDIMKMLSCFGDYWTNKDKDRKSDSNAGSYEIETPSDGIEIQINIKRKTQEDVDLSECLAELKIGEDIPEKRPEDSKTGSDTDDVKTACECIPRGKNQLKTPSKTPYDRPGVYDKVCNGYETAPFADDYNLYGYYCNFMKHREGLSGGNVLTRPPYYEPVCMAPQLVHARPVADDYQPINCYDPGLYIKVESPQTVSASTHIPNYCLSPPESIPDQVNKAYYDNPSTSQINFELPSCLNSPPSIGQFPGIDLNDELDIGERTPSMVDIFSTALGCETPPQDEDPLEELIVIEEDGELVLGVRDDSDKRIYRKYIEFIARDVANQADGQDEELQAYRLIASMQSHELTRLDENQNTLIMDLINTGFGRASFKALLDRYERNGLLSEYINKKNKSKRAPLHFATYHKEIEKTRLLVERGADVNAPVFTPYPGERRCKKESLIGHYSSKGQDYLPVFIELLCSPNADVNSADSDGSTPLHTAILSHGVDNINSKEIIYHLIMRGADINMKNNLDSRTPLYCAIQHGYHMVDYLFQVIKAVYPSDHSSRIKSMVRPGFTMLKLAYDLCTIDLITKIKLINLLLEHGAELTQKSPDSALRKELLNFQGVEVRFLTKVRK